MRHIAPRRCRELRLGTGEEQSLRFGFETERGDPPVLWFRRSCRLKQNAARVGGHLVYNQPHWRRPRWRRRHLSGGSVLQGGNPQLPYRCRSPHPRGMLKPSMQSFVYRRRGYSVSACSACGGSVNRCKSDGVR